MSLVLKSAADYGEIAVDGLRFWHLPIFPYWPDLLRSSTFCFAVLRHYFGFHFEVLFMVFRRIDYGCRVLGGGY